jgi:hypothetical protein
MNTINSLSVLVLILSGPNIHPGNHYMAIKKVSLLHAPCPMLHALCPMLSALCPLLKIPGRVPFGSLGVVELIVNCEFVGS